MGTDQTSFKTNSFAGKNQWRSPTPNAGESRENNANNSGKKSVLANANPKMINNTSNFTIN